MICELLAHGETERSACIRAGIGLTVGMLLSETAQIYASVLQRLVTNGRKSGARHTAALHESQGMRAANRKAPKPRPIHQANLVVWHLRAEVRLNIVAIPETEIIQACERFNLPPETWRRQESAFGLLKKVYARRAQFSALDVD
jgi:hypothetical protein